MRELALEGRCRKYMSEEDSEARSRTFVDTSTRQSSAPLFDLIIFGAITPYDPTTPETLYYTILGWLQRGMQIDARCDT